MRLDRLLALLGEGTRSQVRGAVREGRVTVNGAVAHDAGMRVDAAASRVCMDGRELSYRRVRHVMDLLPPMYAAMGCMPAGRLDKDTEGLLILTSDGQLAHRLLSPRHEVGKVYFVRVDGPLGEEDQAAFAAGLHIRDSDGEFDARPAALEILASSPQESEASVRVTEGRYHQVKRMFGARGRRVLFLKRLQIGALKLDPALAPGQWREITEEEIRLLIQEETHG